MDCEDPFELKVIKTTLLQGRLNAVYVNPEVKQKPNDFVLLDDRLLFYLIRDSVVPKGCIALSKAQREFVEPQDTVLISSLSKSYVPDIKVIKFSLEMVSAQNIEILSDEMKERIFEIYTGFPFNQNQRLFIDVGDEKGTVVLLTVEEMICEDKMPFGILVKDTEITLRTDSVRIKLIDSSPLIRKDFSLSEIGIGGLKSEFGRIFRRAFVQRLFEPDVIKKFGFQHVKGIILYGPPGTGKTLIARKLGSLLNARPPKIVNGPEILNKYVGQSEENIRKLFTEAEAEYRAYGQKSQLHIIIFDEIDAICKRRGSGGSAGAGDQVVNQLLSKMDGVEALDNILVVGMTNRLDMIDEALLRPGRFEIHLEISLPDEEARKEIFEIHTKKMTQNSLLDEKVSLSELAKMTKNYTGAEIAAVVRSGCSFALEKQIELRKADQESSNIGVAKKDSEIVVTMEDMVRGINEVRPAFGVDEDDFIPYKRLFYETSQLRQILSIGKSVLSKLRNTNLYGTTSILLFGDNGTGKTSLAVRIAKQSGFPFIKIISPRHLVGSSEYDKVNYIKDVFLNAYKSEEACVIIDDIEGLIEFVNLGARFSNAILQALKIFIKAEDKNKICVIGTSSMPDVLKETGIFECFVEISSVAPCSRQDYEELCEQNPLFEKTPFSSPVPITNLLASLPEPDASN